MNEPPQLSDQTIKLLKAVVAALEDKKAEDLVVVQIGAVASLCDVFVICSGTSSRHVSSLVDETVERCRAIGEKPIGVEGLNTGWALIDYGDVVVHAFDRDTRGYYDLEKLWLDAPRLDAASLQLSLAS